MAKDSSGGKRHLSVVSDQSARDGSKPALFDVEPEPEPEFILPPGLTSADILAHLEESDAPPEILKLAAGFGDNIQGLLSWLEESAVAVPEAADLLGHWEALLGRGVNALDAELFGLEFLHMFTTAAEGSDTYGPLLALIGEAANTGMPEALAMARVLAHVGPAEIRPAAVASANRLANAGVKDRPWVRALGTETWRSAHGYVDPNGTMETISLEFQIGTKTHSCVVLIDHRLGGGVKDCWFSPDVGRLLTQLRLGAISQQIEFKTYTRSQAGSIIGAALSAPPCPVDPDQIEDVNTFLPLLQMRATLVVDSDEQHPSPVRSGSTPVSRPTKSKPVRRSPIHRIKVTLAQTKPPIWRRLEVPSTTTLAALSEIVQMAFEWDGSHLWLYETPSGEYGLPDRGMEFRDAGQKTLGSAAPRVGSKMTYVYDFGDDWRHTISVEAIGPPDDAAHYPLCTAGRRAAPPEDCGGPWGYENLLATLADPEDAEHESMLEWLGLESADEFDPAEFDVDDVNAVLDRF